MMIKKTTETVYNLEIPYFIFMLILLLLIYNRPILVWFDSIALIK